MLVHPEQSKEESKADILEKELRAKWTADGVSQKRQDAILAEVTGKAQLGAQIGPFVIGLKANIAGIWR